jgi:two-component system sensor histidine kinase RstB
MDRLFVRIYLKLFASLLAAALLSGLWAIPRAQQVVQRNITASFAPVVALAATTLGEAARRGEDLEPLLAKLRAGGLGAALLPREQVRLGLEAEAQLDRGEPVLRGPNSDLHVYVRIPGTARVLREGPLLRANPVGGSRAAALLVAVLAGLLLGVHLLLRPIRRRLGALAEAAERLGEGNIQARAVPGPPDVIGGLAGSFNRMADRIQRLFALQQELLLVVSHELRTPLQRMHFRLEAARDPGPDREEQFIKLDRDIEELGSLVDELLTYARLKEADLDRERTDLRPMLAEVVAGLQPLPRSVTIQVESPETPLLAAVDRRLLCRAVGNLAVNAARHARSRVRIGAALESGAVTIDVDDDGEGVPEAERDRIFEPFQRLATPRTRAGAGFGLGLAIVRRVAERHGGNVRALSADLGGARFRLSLPGG